MADSWKKAVIGQKMMKARRFQLIRADLFTSA
jgi:hypothetical protein